MRAEDIYVIWSCIRIKVNVSHEQNWFSAPSPIPIVAYLLTVRRRFLYCSSSLFVCLCFLMWRLCCPYLVLISPYFGAREGRLRDCGISWVSSIIVFVCCLSWFVCYPIGIIGRLFLKFSILLFKYF